MASCCSFKDSAKAHFDEKDAEQTLARYLRKGPDETTRLLRDTLRETHLASGTVLDIGAGIGVLSLELLSSGATSATAVDASESFVARGRIEAARQGQSERLSFMCADFVDVQQNVPQASLVVMDRAICCYPGYQDLLSAGLRHATHAFAWSYPRDKWFVRLGIGLENRIRVLRNSPFRAFVHPVHQMHRILEGHHFHLVAQKTTRMWAIEVYRHAGPNATTQ